MTNKLIHNVESGEVEILPLSIEDLAQLEAERIKAEAETQAKAEATAAKAALLAKLGITEEEAKLLLS